MFASLESPPAPTEPAGLAGELAPHAHVSVDAGNAVTECGTPDTRQAVSCTSPSPIRLAGTISSVPGVTGTWNERAKKRAMRGLERGDIEGKLL